MARVAKTGGDGSKQASAGSPFIEWFFRPAMLFRAALVAGVCALWPYVAQKLPSLGARPEYRITFSQIQVSPHPEGVVPSNLVEQVAERAKLNQEFSILDDNLTAKISDAFLLHPWVARVVKVQKSFPAAIRVELEYRQPVAMVAVTGGQIPIDIQGVILPPADFSANDTNRFPLIRTTETAPKLLPGETWNVPAILAAARLAKQLSDKWKGLKLEAISAPKGMDASIDPNDVPLELIGKTGSRIVWGRGPGSNHPGELESSQKIRRLEKYLTDFGDYHLPSGPYEIDIRHWQEISRRPLASEQVQSKSAKVTKPESKARLESSGSKQESSGPKQEAKFQKPDRRRS